MVVIGAIRRLSSRARLSSSALVLVRAKRSRALVAASKASIGSRPSNTAMPKSAQSLSRRVSSTKPSSYIQPTSRVVKGAIMGPKRKVMVTWPSAHS